MKNELYPKQKLARRSNILNLKKISLLQNNTRNNARHKGRFIFILFLVFQVSFIIGYTPQDTYAERAYETKHLKHRNIVKESKGAETEGIVEETENADEDTKDHEPESIVTSKMDSIAEEPIKLGIIKVSIANIREKPTTQSDILGKLKKGEMISIISKMDTWYEIRLDEDTSGWIFENLFYDITDDFHMAAIKVLVGNIRKEPTKKSLVIGKLKMGDKVLVLSRDKQWIQVRMDDGSTGWAYNSLFIDESVDSDKKEKVTTQTPMDASDSIKPLLQVGDRLRVIVRMARVRSAPDFDSAIKFKIPKGTNPVLRNIQDDWYQILTDDGRTGWSHSILFSEKKHEGSTSSEKEIASAITVRTKTERTIDTGKFTKLKEIRFLATSKEEEKIFFLLSKENIPEASVIEGENPKVVCKFFKMAPNDNMEKDIPINGNLIKNVQVLSQDRSEKSLTIELHLKPNNNYQVERIYFKEDTTYMIGIQFDN